MLLSKPFFTGTFDKHLVFIKGRKKRKNRLRRKEKYTPYLFLKASVFPQNCYFLEIRGRYDSRSFLVFILCIG